MEKLTALRAQTPGDLDVATELARSHNEIGNVRSALGARPAGPASLTRRHSTSSSPARQTGRPRSTGTSLHARSTSWLENASLRPAMHCSRAADARSRRFASPLIQSSEYRNSAIRILDGLIGESPRAPDYRLLLALCHRWLAGADGLGVAVRGVLRAGCVPLRSWRSSRRSIPAFPITDTS